jgi:hypothetical protein
MRRCTTSVIARFVASPPGYERHVEAVGRLAERDGGLDARAGLRRNGTALGGDEMDLAVRPSTPSGPARSYSVRIEQ